MDLDEVEKATEKEPKPWDLTPEQLKMANERTPEQDQTDEQEMSVEELDKITAGQPVVEEEEER